MLPNIFFEHWKNELNDHSLTLLFCIYPSLSLWPKYFKLTSYLERRYVRIVNHLNNKPLTYHCEFADDDFGNVCFTFPALHASILHDVCVYIYVCMSTPRCYSTTYRGDAHAHYTCCGNVSYLGCVIGM